MQHRQKKTKQEIILYEKPILKGMLVLALPLFLNNIIKSFHDMVDVFFLARMSDNSLVETSLSIMNVHFPTYFFFMAVGIAFSVATVTIISQYLGARRPDLAQKYASKILSLTIISGLIITAAILILAPTIVRLIGIKEASVGLASTYFRIRALEFIPVFLFLIYQAIRQAEGKTLLPGVINISGLLVNVVLTWLFVDILNMGVAGAAWSTLIGQSIGLPFIIYGLFFTRSNLRVSTHEMKPDKETNKDIFKIMIPAMAASALNSLGFIIIQARILYYGEDISSGFGAGNRVSQLISNSLMAVSTVLSTYIGNNVGNNNPKRARESYWIALGFILGASVVLTTSFIFLREHLILLLLGNTISDNIMKPAMSFSFWLLLTQPMMAVIWADNSFFNGSGHARLSLISGVVRLWFIRIPLLYILAWAFPSWSYHTIWIAMMISNAAIIVINVFLKRRVTLERTVRFDVETQS